MYAALKSEFQKLLTVRSTFVISLLALVMIAIFAFYVEGLRGISGSASSELSPRAIEEIIVNAGGTVAAFSAIIAVLFMVHEYRYNTIVYTLTACKSRSKVLLAKIVTVTSYVVFFTLFAMAFAVGCYYLGLSLRDATLPPQDWNAAGAVGKALVYNISFSLIGLLTAIITRSIAAAVALIFLVPNTVEPLIGLLIKDNAVYLPFAALEKVVATSASQSLVQGELAPGKAILIVSAYLIVGWAITWSLFLKRDAN